LSELNLVGKPDPLLVATYDETLRYSDFPDELVIVREKITVIFLYSVPQGGVVQGVLIATLGRHVGVDEVTKVIELQNSALAMEGESFQGEVGNVKCVAKRNGLIVTVIIVFLDELRAFNEQK